MFGFKYLMRTGKRLVIPLLLLFLTVKVFTRFIYLLSIDTQASQFNRNVSLSVAQAEGIYNQNNIRRNTLQLDAKIVSEHPFLMEKIINQHNFEYVIRPNVTCSEELVICVAITSDNYAGRSVIRRTWGRYAKDPNNKAILLFFLGSEKEETDTRLVMQSRLHEEASTFGDIVQENYIDSYKNLTLKTVSILKWIISFCPKTKYILKVDDDMYVNVPFLMKTLQEFAVQSSPPSAFILGSIRVNVTPERDPKSRYFAPYSVFKEKIYPTFVCGPIYVMTREAAVLLYEASLRVPRFWLEDVYITGLCARKTQVPVFHSKYFWISKPEVSGCFFRTMICGNVNNHDEIEKIYTELYDPNLQC